MTGVATAIGKLGCRSTYDLCDRVTKVREWGLGGNTGATAKIATTRRTLFTSLLMPDVP